MEITQTLLVNNYLHIFFDVNGNGDELKRDSSDASANTGPVLSSQGYFSDTHGGGREGGEGRSSLRVLIWLAPYIETLPSQPGMPLMPNVQQAVYRHDDN